MSPINSPGIKKVMISSTARDLPEHRKVVLDACLRQGMFPIMMEYLPASDADAVAESMRMVNEADLYLGIFAFRYGYIPKSYDISVTEMEYNRAVERGIPRLLFLMHEKHPVTVADVERGEGATKLEALKERQKTERVVNFFKSPEELHAQVINSLSYYRQPNLTAFHYVSDIPEPPEPYIAHPYTLLQTQSLIGRQAELNLLTDWVASPDSNLYQARILSVVAIGGMGKSALTWKWFHDIAPHEMHPLAGRLWWSFYESDATFENFVIRALAYVSRRTREEIQKLPLPECEAQLLSILDREPFLLVLDGLERLFIAYARMDAARLADDDLDERTANVVTGRLGLPKSAAQSFTGQLRLRKTADVRVGTFLRKLTTAYSSRILISTRLYPADLQTVTGVEHSGCAALFLQGLSDDDALNLWRAFGISGSREALLPLFHTFDNHPLLTQVLAGEIAHDRRSPGNFDLWRKTHSAFNPFHMPLVQVKSHVLDYALRGLDQTTLKVLDTIAAFRMPAAYDTLVALFVGKGKPCLSENVLIGILTDLEDRGLLGWDRRANRYDLHPIVRGIVWYRLLSPVKQNVCEILRAHFSSLPPIKDLMRVKYVEELTPSIELYNSLIGLGHYDEAYKIFRERLRMAIWRLGSYRQGAELLEMLFPNGLDELPHLSRDDEQAEVLRDLAILRINMGLLDQGARMLHHYIVHWASRRQQEKLSTGWANLASCQLLAGHLYDAEFAARNSLRFSDNSSVFLGKYWLMSVLAARGANYDQQWVEQVRLSSLARSTALSGEAQRALLQNEPRDALLLANEAWNAANIEPEFIHAARRQGEASLLLGDLSNAEERLHHVLNRARKVNLVEEELSALIGLAEVRRRQGDLKTALELLDDVWESAERGPYRLLHTNALNVLAQLERDADDHAKAVKAATEAYRLAWCDGLPFAYLRGLQIAKTHLAALRESEPILPPLDASKYDPMPQVEVGPLDE